MSKMFENKEHTYYSNEKARVLLNLYQSIEKKLHDNKMMLSDDLVDSINTTLDKILDEFDKNVIWK